MSYLLHLLTLISIYAILAYSLNLLVGYAGLLSLAHAAFYGIGAYVYALLTLHADLSFPLAVALAAGFAGAAGLAMGLVALRCRGDLFILATLGLQQIVTAVLYNWTSLTRGPYGIAGIPAPRLGALVVDTLPKFFLFAATTSLLVGLLLLAIYRSPFGLVLKAIRDDERVSEALGYSSFRSRLCAFGIAAGLAAVAGALYAGYLTYIDPTSFALPEGILLLSMLLVGGSGNLRGPLVGVGVLLLLPEVLRFVGLPATIAPHVRQMIYGLTLIALMYWRPKGLAGAYAVE